MEVQNYSPMGKKDCPKHNQDQLIDLDFVSFGQAFN